MSAAQVEALVAAYAVPPRAYHNIEHIQAVLRESGTILASRIAGLLLSAIAVQMMADGVFGFLAQAH